MDQEDVVYREYQLNAVRPPDGLGWQINVRRGRPGLLKAPSEGRIFDTASEAHAAGRLIVEHLLNDY